MFRNLTLALALLASISMTAQNPISRHTVSMGAGYAQNVWYNLNTDAEVKGAASGWNLAVSVRPFDVAIWINHADQLFYPVNTAANFATVAPADTAVAVSKGNLYNSDANWNDGAFNRTQSGAFDYGWGNYSQVNNNVTGDSTYLLKMASGTWKKVVIEKLVFDTIYTIKFANLDNSNSQTISINKKNYTGKSFVYLNLNTNAILDLQPASAAWDLVFTRYQTILPNPGTGVPTPYIVAGVKQNSTIAVIRGQTVVSGVQTVRRVSRDTTSDAVDITKLAGKITTIGGDWKAFTGTAWSMADSLTYFVKAQNNRYYKLIFKDFGGTANGNFVFTKELLPTSVSTKDVLGKNASLAITPNPATDGNLTVVYDFGSSPQQAGFQLFNVSGQTVFAQKLPNTEGVQTLTLPTLGLQTGLYFAQIRYDGKTLTQKVVVR